MRFASTLLGFVMQIHIFHWMTTSYAQHKALGELYESIFDLTDDFVEDYIGKYGREITPNAASVIQYNIEDVNSVIANFEGFLHSMDVPDTDLLNIRDEMLQAVHKAQYLLTLS